MKKSHGPAFRKVMKPLRECNDCRGKGFARGISYDLDCFACNASGWVCAETGDALPLADLVLQLNMKLRAADHQLAQFRKLTPCGAQQQYEQNNRLGAGGTNYTGD